MLIFELIQALSNGTGKEEKCQLEPEEDKPEEEGVSAWQKYLALTLVIFLSLLLPFSLCLLMYGLVIGSQLITNLSIGIIICLIVFAILGAIYGDSD